MKVKKSRGKVLLIAQEIELARELASNNKTIRDKAVKKVKKWFTSRSQGIHKFEKDDFMRIWKGLFYCMWMSDKPIVQEDLAEEISKLVHSLVTVDAGLKFLHAAFTVLSIEWFGIDDLRINKFMMLVRRIIRQSFTFLAQRSWDNNDVKALADIYYSVLTETNSLGLKLHLIEIYCEELAKIGGEELSADHVLTFVTPFAKYMASTKDGRLISHITRNMFLHLIQQSEMGIEYLAKFDTWKQLGFPGGSIDALQRTELEGSDGEEDFKDDDETEHKELDPRAGRINVDLPTLKIAPESFISMLATLKTSCDTTVKARKTIVSLIQKFEKLSEGKFPLGMHTVEFPEIKPFKKDINHKSKKINRKQSAVSKKNLEDENEFQNTNKSKTSQTKLNWIVTESDNKETQELDRENIVALEETNFTEVKPNSFKRKHDKSLNRVPVAKDTLHTKQQNINTFQITESKGCEAIKVKQKKDNFENELNKIKKRKLKQNGIKVKRLEKSNVSRNKTSKKNKGDKKEDGFCSPEANNWGGKEWEMGLQEGETEIFVPSKKYMQRLAEKGGGVTAALLRHHLGESRNMILNPFASPSTKKVGFALSLNTSQEHFEYRKSLKRKSDIPFDSLNQPKKGVLKSTPVGRFINPFFQIDKT